MSQARQSRPQLRPPLAVGDIAPQCVLTDLEGKIVDLRSDSIAGNPIVVVFCPQFTSAVQATLADFRAHAQELADARVFSVTQEFAKVAVEHKAGFPMLLDRKGEVSLAFSATSRDKPTTVVLRPNHHVAGIFKDAPETHAEKVSILVRRLITERQPTPTVSHPPVLIIPEMLSLEDCQRLVSIYETRGKEFVAPGVGYDEMQSDYKMRIPEYGRGDRIDHWIVDKDTCVFLDHRLVNRVLPEIAKAFHYRITKYERMRIGCYQGIRGGELHGHRDNVPPTTYRRFAMSINLNTDEFIGGELRFPEFSDQRYRLASGDALVFSSSLLHEALPVTSGRRLVLLAFLFGDI